MKKGVIRMIPWWYLPIALVVGVTIGIILVALVSANEE